MQKKNNFVLKLIIIITVSLSSQTVFAMIHPDTLLINSSREGDYQAVQSAFKIGANVNAVDIYGNSSLHYAAEKRFLTIADLLIEKGANVNLKNNEGTTPIFIPVNFSSNYIVRLLLVTVAELNIEALDTTPLYEAI